MPTNMLKLNKVHSSKQGINLKYHASLLVADIFSASEITAWCWLIDFNNK